MMKMRGNLLTMRRSMMLLLLCHLFFPLFVRAQESMTQTMAGPSGDKYRIMVAFMAPVGDDSYRLQSFILDIDRVKKNEQPRSFYLDLTTTDRLLSTGDKKQKILVQRWSRSGDVEVKCEGGKWLKQSTGAELDAILETVNAVVKIVPLDAPTATQFSMTPDVEKKITNILASLTASKLQCVRMGAN